MMNTFKAIPIVNNDISNVDFLASTLLKTDINSPADTVARDIKFIASHMITPDTSIDEALTIMKRSNNMSKLYVGAGTKLLGIIDSFTLMSRNVLMIANRKGLVRTDLTVADIMSVTQKMPVIVIDSLLQSCVGDVVETMKQHGEANLKIIDKNNMICGLVSAIDISRALNIPIDINVTAGSFKDCFDVIHEHAELI